MGPLIGLIASLAMGFVLDRVRKLKFVLAAVCAGQVLALILLSFLVGAALPAAPGNVDSGSHPKTTRVR